MASKPTVEPSSGDEAEEEALPLSAPTKPSSLSIFHEDILLAILSYVADVPFEAVDSASRKSLKTLTAGPIDSHSSLTHSLPFVSKQFHKLTRQHDFYWKHALLRQVRKEPTLWEVGAKRVLFNARCDELRAEVMRRSSERRNKRTKHGELNEQPPFESKIKVPSSPDSEHPSGSEALLQLACTAIQLHPPHHRTAVPSGTYQRLYQSIVLGHLRYKAPVFCMPSRVRLGGTYGLHLFEPRYRLMISEVMARYPVGARRGARIPPLVPGVFPTPGSIRGRSQGDIKAAALELAEGNAPLLREHQLPTFIHAHQMPLRPNTPATIVRVEQCVIHPNGTADVFLKPLSYIYLEEIWDRPGTGGLVEATGLRMGKAASESYERWCNMRG